jgi:hypothetical protein
MWCPKASREDVITDSAAQSATEELTFEKELHRNIWPHREFQIPFNAEKSVSSSSRPQDDVFSRRFLLGRDSRF